MKILLAAINAKYIHTNPAVYSLRAYARARVESAEISVREFTINESDDAVLQALVREHPDVLAISTYIWNSSMADRLLPKLHELLPDTALFTGGPEVSFHTEDYLSARPYLTGVLVSEGEVTFTELVKAYEKGTVSSASLRGIPGLFLPGMKESELVLPAPLSMDDVPFFYEEWANDASLGPFAHKILYYETSRGCPYRCSYCLSSIDKTLRYRNVDKVFRELDFFLSRNVKQVKFIDRTFNADRLRAEKIWSYIAAHDNGITNFHFEIAGDLLTESAVQILSSMRPGLVQLEIGVQSTNPETLKSIQRTADFRTIASFTEALKQKHNIHQHLDLIAGLPYEDLASFRKSFNDLMAVRPDDLQLGFLKVLKGTRMET